MKILKIILFFVSCTLSAQRNFPIDSLKLSEVQDLFADDYGNIYLYKNKDFSLTKYDSLGVQKGKLMLTFPFKIQSVKNPLNIPLFSENTQELRFFDQNLNPIQTINFRQKLGLIKMAYTEDLQQVWLLDGSMKRLIQYNFRQGNVINSFPMDFDFEEICDMLVFDNRLFLLKEDSLLIYNFRSEKILEIPVVDAKRFRRENFDILIVCKNTVQKLENNTLKIIFNAPDSQIVDKNSSSYFAIKGNKLYLYKIVVDQ